MIQNPFANYGKMVYGSRFIGREEEIHAIRNRIFGEYYGNLAIIGLPRIGKSSLAWQAIVEYQNQFPQEKILTLWMSMGDFEEADTFFLEMLRNLQAELTQNPMIELELFEKFFQKNLGEELSHVELQRLLFDCYSLLKRNNIRVICILDEFDAVRKYFRAIDFHFLRKLSYNPDTAICVVTTSRRYLSDIELNHRIDATSNFHQTFDNIYLGMYRPVDLAEYWEKFFNSKVPISEAGKQQIYNFTGHHPYLLDMFNYHLFNNSDLNDIDQSVEDTKTELNLTMETNYDLIFTLLKDENLERKLLQMVVGPVYDIKMIDVEKMERYQLVLRENGGYRGFSNNFHNYLFKINREVPIWELWTETEIRLRSMVEMWLQERYGEDWIPKFRKLSPAKEAFVAKLEEMQAKEQKSFPDTYSHNLLEFTCPADLFDQFMRVEWKWFKPIFSNREANEWKPIFDVLARIRNPSAHNKQNILKDFERNKAVSYCQEIVNRIEYWEKSRIS